MPVPSFCKGPLEMSGTGTEISLVHWKQQWLDNGTLYFHVSMSGTEQLAQGTEPTARQPAHILHEHAHLLHVSVMMHYDAPAAQRCDDLHQLWLFSPCPSPFVDH
ncbi:astrotactin-2-like isoform X2 [Arapaima gigas]